MLKKGDEVEAVVLEVSPENQRISLGLKQAQEDPWAGISSRYRIGQLIKGKVSKLASFGAFVELEEGVDGLVHISQISDDHVAKIRDVLQPGQEVEARVIKIDPIDRRIGLSIKAAKLAEEEFKVDDSMLEGLRPGEDLVDLAGAFDAAHRLLRQARGMVARFRKEGIGFAAQLRLWKRNTEGCKSHRSLILSIFHF